MSYKCPICEKIFGTIGELNACVSTHAAQEKKDLEQKAKREKELKIKKMRESIEIKAACIEEKCKELQSLIDDYNKDAKQLKNEKNAPKLCDFEYIFMSQKEYATLHMIKDQPNIYDAMDLLKEYLC